MGAGERSGRDVGEDRRGTGRPPAGDRNGAERRGHRRRRRQERSGVLTLANRLTILRILLTPAIAIFLLYRYTAIALILFVAAGITDGLDGFVARRRGQR
ncbi:MAG: CDP-alcohol phosphatidyltransferase family protein, partial [Zetaproteobacteria bacterium]